MAEPLSYLQLEGRSWPHPRIIGQVVLALDQGDSILPLVTSHPAGAGLTSVQTLCCLVPPDSREACKPLEAPNHKHPLPCTL